MTKPNSIKKIAREKIYTTVLKAYEELTGFKASDKAKKLIEKKSKKLSQTIIGLLKKESKKKKKKEAKAVVTKKHPVKKKSKPVTP
jgi:hypothetical protein